MDSHINKNRKRFMTSSSTRSTGILPDSAVYSSATQSGIAVWRGRYSRIFSLIAVLILLCHSVVFFSHPAQAAGTTHYVNQAATGTGCSSWADACPDLQTALGKATSGDEIWVAAGVYMPGTAPGDTFQLKSGVGIYGGFAGTETTRTQRSWEGYVTTLSGDLDSGNSAHIVTGSDTDDTAILDGFTITKGRAKSDTISPHGSGVYIKEGSPTLNNIIFIDNKAEYGTASHGGAVYCTDTGSPSLTNIVFEANKSVNRGGGMYSKDGCYPTLTNVTFIQNKAQWEGGGMFNQKNTAILNNVTFIENELYTSENAFGAGLANSSSNVTLNNVAFIGNLALTSANASGGGMYTERHPIEEAPWFDGEPSNITLNNVSFINNQAKSRGGGMTTKNSAATMTGVIFKGNKIALDGHGGAMMNDKTTDVTIQNGIFIGNQAINRGGAIYNTKSPQVTLSHVTFTDNQAQKNGGAIYNTDSTVTLNHAEFTNNEATENGGAIYNIDSTTALSHVEFTGNTTTKKGGGIFNKYSPIDIANAIFINNTAGWGGGLSNDESDDEATAPAGTKATITNALFHGNVSEGDNQFDAEGGGVFNSRVELTVRNATFSNNTAISNVGTHQGRGGGLFVKWSYPDVSNSIFWGNKDSMAEGNGTENAQIRRRDPNPPTNSKDGVIINDSIIEQFSDDGYYTPTFVLNNGPLFVKATTNNLRLQSVSPAIDSGNNADIPADILDLDGDSNTIEGTPWDLDNNPRIVNSTVDMGAYEYGTTTTSAPTDMTLSASSVNEHDLGATIGTLSTTGGTGSYTYEIFAGNTDVFEISDSTLKLKAGMSLDYYEDLTYEGADGTFLGEPHRLITIKSTDANGKTVVKTFTITVNDRNEAPILHVAGDAKLPPIDQNITDANNAGINVSELIASVLPLDMITDLNPDTQGIAVVAADTTKGTWEYYENSFDGWEDFGTVSENAALLLPGGPAAENDWKIRFKPNGDSGTATLSFRAWDRTTGSSGITVNTTTNGDGTSYSIAIETASIDVIGTAQYAPVVTDASTNEDTMATNGLVITPNTDDTDVTHFKIVDITGGTLYKSDGSTDIADDEIISLAEGATGLQFMPTAESVANGSFNVYAATTADGYGLSSDPAVATITINPVADTPSVTDASTNEDTQTSTGLVLSRKAVDGDEITHFKITNITGGTLYQNDGTTIDNDAFITYAEGQDGLRFTPTKDATASGSFTVYAAASDTGDGLSAAAATATITITSIADAPTVSVTNGSLETQEDVPLEDIIIARNAADGADVTHFKITDISGGTLKKSNGSTISANTFITYDEAQAGLTFVPPENTSGSGSFTVYAATSDTGDGASGETNVTIPIQTVADPPSITAATWTINEDTSLTGIAIVRNAADGSEVMHVKITDLTGGTLTTEGGVTITTNEFIIYTDQLANLTFVPEANSSAKGSFTVYAATSDQGDGLSAAANATITINPVADTPSVTDATTTENTQTTDGLVLSRNDVDGAEIGYFKITNITGGTLYKNNGTSKISDGSFITYEEGHAGLTFTPDYNATAGQFDVQAAPNANDTRISEAVSAHITIQGVAHKPSVTSTSTDEDTQTTSGLKISRNFADGEGEVTHFKITAIEGGTLFKNDGVTIINDGDSITYAEGNAGLKFTPTANATANGSFLVQAALSANGEGLSEEAAKATITINAINDAPVHYVPGEQTIAGGATLTFAGATQISIEDVDAGDNAIDVQLTATNGTLKLSDGQTGSSLRLTKPIADIQDALDGMVFTPNNGFLGIASVRIETSDEGHTGDGEVGTATDEVTIYVGEGIPTVTPTPTSNGSQPISTNTPGPTVTPSGATSTPIPTNTPGPTVTPNKPTNTPWPTVTPGGSTLTPKPTSTPWPTVTPGGPTLTPMPTVTPGGPTLTPTPTPTPSRTPIKVSGTLKEQSVNMVKSTDEQFQAFLPPGGVSSTATFTAEETFIMPSDVVTGYTGVRHFTMGVTSESGKAITAFDEPMSVSIAYTPEELIALGIGDANSLYLAYFDEQTQQWIELETTVDAENNRVIAELDQPAEIVLLGKVTLMPTPTPTRTPAKASGIFDPQSGGDAESPDRHIQVFMQPGGVSSTTTFTMEETFTMPQDLPIEYSSVRAFTMGAITTDGERLTSFDKPLTVSIAYTDDMLAALGITDESSLSIVYFDAQTQKQLYPLEATVKEEDNRIVVALDRLSNIVLLGKVSATPTPTVTPTPDADPTMRPTVASPTETPITTPTPIPSEPATPTATPIPNTNDNLKLAMSAPTASVPGNVLHYDITCENIGNTTLQDVEIVMSAPDYTTFNASASTPEWETADQSLNAVLSASERYVYPVGEMEPGATADDIVFAVVVNDNFPIGFNLRANVAVQSSGSDPLEQESITYVGLYNVFLPLIAASRTSQTTYNPPTPIPTSTPIVQPEPGLDPTATAIPSISPTPIAGPDLMITNFSVSPSSPVAGSPARITVVVKNQGTQHTDGFWVDFYSNPSSVPTQSGIPWNTVCGTDLCRGITWSVDEGLAPGASVTLTSDSFVSLYTVWDGTFAMRGTNNLYAYVDSWSGYNDAQGSVDEANETNNMAHLPITVQ